MVFDVVSNCTLEFGDATKDTSADAIYCDVSEESFDRVQPRGARWCEVNVKPWVPQQPTLHPWMFMRGIIVHNEVQLLAGWSLLVNHL